MVNNLPTLLLLSTTVAIAPQGAVALSSPSTNLQQNAVPSTTTIKDRPLLRKFGNSISERVINSKEGYNRFGLDDHYTSAETIPCLDLQTTAAAAAAASRSSDEYDSDMSSRRDIRKAYTANDNTQQQQQQQGDGLHGRSSGSGCCIIRLQGKDAASVRGLIDFADNFFEGVDKDDTTTTTTSTTAKTTTKSERAARKLKDLGVFRIENNVHAGFDQDVNNEGKMQVLYTKLIPPPPSNLQNTDNDEDEDEEGEDPLLLPLEVGELVGSASLRRAHSGMSTLFDIGSQITSAVLGMDSESTNKLLDDCSRVNDSSSKQQQHEMRSENHQEIANTMSNSYQRIIRYLKPKQQQQPQSSSISGSKEEKEEDDAAFWPHVDSTFLTLIPLPDVAGLEVWCPSSLYSESDDLSERGEWVRPIKPLTADTNDVHVVALAGEFMQLLSNGDVPTCIHRVIAPKPTPPFGFAGSSNAKKYKPRVSAPLFLRPRKGEEAILDVESDLRDSDNPGLYFEEGLLEECDSMRVWDYMDCMSPDN